MGLRRRVRVLVECDRASPGGEDQNRDRRVAQECGCNAPYEEPLQRSVAVAAGDDEIDSSLSRDSQQLASGVPANDVATDNGTGWER